MTPDTPTRKFTQGLELLTVLVLRALPFVPARSAAVIGPDTHRAGGRRRWAITKANHRWQTGHSYRTRPQLIQGTQFLGEQLTRTVDLLLHIRRVDPTRRNIYFRLRKAGLPTRDADATARRRCFELARRLAIPKWDLGSDPLMSLTLRAMPKSARSTRCSPSPSSATMMLAGLMSR